MECWPDGELVGGLYGVSLHGAFFGESMFSRRTDASKVALVHLVARLIAGGYRLLDAQFMTEHLTQFGAHGDFTRSTITAAWRWRSRPRPTFSERAQARTGRLAARRPCR